MPRVKITLSSSLPLLTLLVVATACLACDKESQMDEYRRLYPIPTELPAATCTGANTIGCYVDTVLFVANYFPNLSSWGARTAEGGVRAFIEAEHPDRLYVQAEHPIRPHEIDTRSMYVEMWYNIRTEEIDLLIFAYYNPAKVYAFDLDTINVGRRLKFDLTYDQASARICGTITEAPFREATARFLGDPEFHDTTTLRDLRLDLPVHMGRY